MASLRMLMAACCVLVFLPATAEAHCGATAGEAGSTGAYYDVGSGHLNLDAGTDGVPGPSVDVGVCAPSLRDVPFLP